MNNINLNNIGNLMKQRSVLKTMPIYDVKLKNNAKKLKDQGGYIRELKYKVNLCLNKNP